MEKKIEKQRNNVKNLMKLIKEKPKLRIVPMVDSEIVGDDYSYWAGSFGDARLEEIWVDDERIYFKDEDFEDLVEKKRDNMADEEEFKNLTDEEFDKYAENYVENLKWEEVIVVNIEPM